MTRRPVVHIEDSLARLTSLVAKYAVENGDEAVASSCLKVLAAWATREPIRPEAIRDVREAAKIALRWPVEAPPRPMRAYA
jgi:hypothetical protein